MDLRTRHGMGGVEKRLVLFLFGGQVKKKNALKANRAARGHRNVKSESFSSPFSPRQQQRLTFRRFMAPARVGAALCSTKTFPVVGKSCEGNYAIWGSKVHRICGFGPVPSRGRKGWALRTTGAIGVNDRVGEPRATNHLLRPCFWRRREKISISSAQL